MNVVMELRKLMASFQKFEHHIVPTVEKVDKILTEIGNFVDDLDARVRWIESTLSVQQPDAPIPTSGDAATEDPIPTSGNATADPAEPAGS